MTDSTRTATRRVIIMGAAGRDFHNFNCLARDNADIEVVAFTAAQIPDIEGRVYPPVLAGVRYPQGVPIHAENELQTLISRHSVHEVWFSYSDVSHAFLMATASRVASWGAGFVIVSAPATMLPSRKPVIAVTAVRTGVGKSQTTRHISRILSGLGVRVVAMRHPMPYGDLSRQIWQRYETAADLDRHDCTIEEREEYEPHIEAGFVMYAGIDYAEILRRAEQEADVILWDGGNNDTPFVKPDLHIVLADPHRPGDETAFYPGMVNLLAADLVIVNKVRTAKAEDVEAVHANCAATNPTARIIRCASTIGLADPDAVAGKRVLCIEDGPTLTHGGMTVGAGWFAAKAARAAEIVSPVPYAVGSIADTFAKYPGAAAILPAMGYSDAQIADLQATIEATPCDVVIAGTPIDLSRVLQVSKPMVRATYELEELEPGVIDGLVRGVLGGAAGG